MTPRARSWPTCGAIPSPRKISYNSASAGAPITGLALPTRSPLSGSLTVSRGSSPLSSSRNWFASALAQLRLDARLIELYRKRQPTISEHQQTITGYLRLRAFDDATGAIPLRRVLPSGIGVRPSVGRGKSPGSSASATRPPMESISLEHVSPIEWDKVVLFGQYILDRKLVRQRRRTKRVGLSV